MHTTGESVTGSGEPGDADVTWLHLVDKLQDEVPLLVEQFLSELESSRLYFGELVSRDDLETSATETFILFIRWLRSDSPGDDHSMTAKRLGRLRARQGVAMQDLVDAVQLDFPVLWRRLRHHAGDEMIDVLIDHVERVHLVVDRYSFAVREEFIRESARIERNLNIANQRHLARLFSEGPVSREVLSDISTGLGVAVTDEYDVAVIAPEEVGTVRRAIGEELAAGTLFGHELGPTLVILRPPDRADRLGNLLAGHAGVSFAGVAGLADVRVVARGAVEMLRSHPGLGRLHDYEELLPGALLRHVRTRWVPGYLREESDAVDHMAADEDDPVIPTVRAFLAAGTAKSTASMLYCHRNTVVNRLNSFNRATGLDVNRPADAAVARLLLPVV